MADLEKIFTEVFQKKKWATGESVSGQGSTLKATTSYRKGLLMLLKKYNIQSVVDCACGDWNWMKEIQGDLPNYLGIDIVKDLIEQNKEKYETETVKFLHGNMFEIDQLIDQTDLLIVRHVLEHHKTNDALLFLEKVKKIAKYALITSNNHETVTKDLNSVGHLARGINLELPPFSLGIPLERILDIADMSSWDGVHGVFGYLFKFN